MRWVWATVAEDCDGLREGRDLECDVAADSPMGRALLSMRVGAMDDGYGLGFAPLWAIQDKETGRAKRGIPRPPWRDVAVCVELVAHDGPQLRVRWCYSRPWRRCDP